MHIPHAGIRELIRKKNLVLIIGNDMSMGLVNATNLQDSIRLSMADILPAPHVKYLPPRGEPRAAADRPLWDAAGELWPAFVQA
jgi:hypothetical protein